MLMSFVGVLLAGSKHTRTFAHLMPSGGVHSTEYVLDDIVQVRRDTKAARRLLIRLMKKQGCLPKRIVTDELGSYGAARRQIMPAVEHRSPKDLNNRAENFHQPLRRRERIMKRFKSPRHVQRFVSIHDPLANLFHILDTTSHPAITANCVQRQ